MAFDTPSPVTPVSAVDVANAKQQNVALSSILTNLGDNASAVVTALQSIATAVTNSLIGGTTGTTANRLLRSKGTTGRALQNSPVTCDDSGNLSGIVDVSAASLTLTNGGALRTDTTSGHTALLQAYDVDGTSYTTFVTLTAGNTPTCNLASSVTLGGLGIATLNTNTWNQQQGFPRQSLTDASSVSWNLQSQQTAYLLLTSAVGASRTISAPSNMVSGFTYILFLQQPSSGGPCNVGTWTNFKWPGGTVPTLSTAASAIDIWTGVSDGTYLYGSLQKAYA